MHSVVPLTSVLACDEKVEILEKELAELLEEKKVLDKDAMEEASALAKVEAPYRKEIAALEEKIAVLKAAMETAALYQTQRADEAEGHQEAGGNQISHVKHVIRRYRFNKVVIQYTERIKALMKKGWILWSIDTETNRGYYSTHLGQSSSSWGRNSQTWNIRPTIKGFRVITSENYADGSGKGTPYSIKSSPRVVLLEKIPCPEREDRENNTTCGHCNADGNLEGPRSTFLYQCRIRKESGYSGASLYGPCPNCGEHSYPWGDDECGFEHSLEPGVPVKGMSLSVDYETFELKEVEREFIMSKYGSVMIYKAPEEEKKEG